MSKICPNCQEVYDDDSHGFCSNCGSRLVDNVDVNPALNFGDANAISGGVHVNQSKNITSHDTHYHTTTVHERSKSDSELRLDATNQLRSKAEEIMAERGRIDSVAMGQLRPFAAQLGIDVETFKSIIKDVRSNRNGSANGLSAANARYLQQAQQAVQTNDMDALSNLTPRLEAMAAISQDDNVQYLYYLTLSLLYPIKSMEVYERQTDENYWRSFWAIISYIRTGKHTEATKVLTLFDPLRYEKSEEDQNLLEAYFNIMKEDKDGAQEFLDEILGEPTGQVKPLLRAVESTLYEEEPDSLEVRFYMERVMSKSDVVVKSQKKVDVPTSAETPAKETPKQEVKQSPKPAEEVKPVTQEKKSNKEAEELYTKACAAAGAKRVMLLQKAADAGSFEAMYDLSDCYADGEGVDENMPLAIKWVTKAADAGYVKAQAALGGAYFQGMEGLDQNYALSEKYFLLAAQKDNSEAQAALSLLYIEMEEYEKAMLWARKAAQMEQPMAFLALGRIYDDGLGVDINHIEGLKWFEKAADKGDANAQNLIGNIYLYADYVEHNPIKAFKYYQMAASQGHLEGMTNLGYCYQEGIGTDINIQTAEEWLHKAADGGNADAQNILGNLYHNIMMDDVKAFKYYKLAADQGQLGGMANVGISYLEGQGVKADATKAKEWLRKAADGGQEDAIRILNENPFNSDKLQNKNIAQGLVNTEELLSKGDNALRSKKYKEAYLCYKEARENGDMNAQEKINSLIQLGTNQRQLQKYKEAVNILQPISDGGEQEAQFQLAVILTDGDNVGKNKNKYINYKKGLELFHTLVSGGNLTALTNIGWCYENGHGCKVNYQEALNCYQKAVDNGYIKDSWIIERIDFCKTKLAGPSAIVEKVWIDCDGRKEIYIHCNWIVNNLKNSDAQLKIIVNKKNVKKNLRKEYILNVFKIEYDSTRWDNSIFTIKDYELYLQHNEEETFGLTIEIWQLKNYIPKKLLVSSKELSFTTWNYFKFFSKSILEIRNQKV